MRIIPHFRQHYLITLSAWLAALLVILGTGVWTDRAAFALYLGAVLAGAFFNGRNGGLAATGLAALCLLGQYLLLGADRPKPGGVDFALSLALFTGVGVLAAYLSGECRAAVRMAGHFHHTLARLPDAILLVDAQGRVVYLNAPAEALTGWPGSEAVGQSVQQILPLRDEDSRRPPLDLGAHLANPAAGPAAGTAHLPDRAGTEHLVEYRAEALPARRPSAPAGLLVLRDIGMRRAQEKDLRQRDEQLAELRRRLAEQERTAETLRRGQREQESQTAARIAALEKAGSELRDQLDAERAAAETLRREHARHQDAWQKAEETYQQRLAELTRTGEVLQGQLAEHRRAAEALRRDHARHQDAWKKLEEAQQQRLTELARSQEFLQGQLAERRGVEEALRREQAANQEAWRQTEDGLRRQISELTEANQNLHHQLAECRAAVEDGRRQLAQHRETAQQAEDDLRRQLGDLRAAAEALRREWAADQDAWGQTEATLRQEITELTAAKDRIDHEAAALRQREAELCRELEQAQSDRLRAAEDLRQFHADAAAREQLLQEQARLLHGDLRAAEGLLERVTGGLRPLLVEARAALATERAEGDDTPTLAVQRGLALVDAVWTAHRLGRGNLPVHKERVEAHAVMDRALEACACSLQARRHRLTLSLPLGPEWLLGDPDLLAQALAALLDNACRYTEPGGDIRLMAERHGEELVFRVEDDGWGVAREDVPGLLELSAGHKCYAARGAEGPGLGLALARSLAELHGGRLCGPDRMPERGSAFALVVPACPSPDAIANGHADTAPRLIPFHPESPAMFVGPPLSGADARTA